MSYYTDEEYEQEHNGRLYRWKLVYDEYADTSWIGEYKKDERTFVVDRKAGFLYGDWEDQPEEPYAEEFESDKEYDTAYAAWEEAWDEWHDKGEREVLADVGSSYERYQYQYFRPYAGGIDPTKDLEIWTKYAVQDWKQMYGLERNLWCFVGVVVETDTPSCPCCGNVETLIKSVWGIESDSDDCYFEQTRDDLICELEHELCKHEQALERCKVST